MFFSFYFAAKLDIPRCIFWQFSHHGKIHGIADSHVDVNYRKDYRHLVEYIKENGVRNNRMQIHPIKAQIDTKKLRVHVLYL